MSDEHTSAYLKTVATLSGSECNSIINKEHSEWSELNAGSDATFGNSSTNANNEIANYNRCGQVDLALTTITTTLMTTMAPAIRTTTSPTTFTTPSIAVTTTTETTSALASKRIGGKRSAKIDFVRFDSVETIYKQTSADHDEIIQHAAIRDEIKQ